MCRFCESFRGSKDGPPPHDCPAGIWYGRDWWQCKCGKNRRAAACRCFICHEERPPPIANDQWPRKIQDNGYECPDCGASERHKSDCRVLEWANKSACSCGEDLCTGRGSWILWFPESSDFFMRLWVCCGAGNRIECWSLDDRPQPEVNSGKDWPHVCPRCSAPACIIFTSIECSRSCGV